MIADATSELEVADIARGAEVTDSPQLLLVRKRFDPPANDPVYQLLWYRQPAQHDAANWKIKAAADKK